MGMTPEIEMTPEIRTTMSNSIHANPAHLSPEPGLLETIIPIPHDDLGLSATPEAHPVADSTGGTLDPNRSARAKVLSAHAACVAGSHITPPI